MDQTITQQTRFTPTRGVIPTLEPLAVDIEDDRLLKYLSDLEKKSKQHWDSEDINLTKRRERNEKYLFGRQLKGVRLKKYESEFIDNTIYEFEATLKSMATSKMPDIIIKPTVYGDDEKVITADLFKLFLTISTGKVVPGDVTF